MAKHNFKRHFYISIFVCLLSQQLQEDMNPENKGLRPSRYSTESSRQRRSQEWFCMWFWRYLICKWHIPMECPELSSHLVCNRPGSVLPQALSSKWNAEHNVLIMLCNLGRQCRYWLTWFDIISCFFPSQMAEKGWLTVGGASALPTLSYPFHSAAPATGRHHFVVAQRGLWFWVGGKVYHSKSDWSVLKSLIHHDYQLGSPQITQWVNGN